MTMDRDTFHDYVVAHGCGAPTETAYATGVQLLAQGDDYATAAAEVVARGMTEELAEGAAHPLDEQIRFLQEFLKDVADSNPYSTRLHSILCTLRALKEDK